MAPISPISDNERTVEKYSPWAFRDEGADRGPIMARSPVRPLYQPTPKDVELLLKTYWTSIHPVRIPPCLWLLVDVIENIRSIGQSCTNR